PAARAPGDSVDLSTDVSSDTGAVQTDWVHYGQNDTDSPNTVAMVRKNGANLISDWIKFGETVSATGFNDGTLCPTDSWDNDGTLFQGSDNTCLIAALEQGSIVVP